MVDLKEAYLQRLNLHLMLGKGQSGLSLQILSLRVSKCGKFDTVGVDSNRLLKLNEPRAMAKANRYFIKLEDTFHLGA